MKTTNDIPTNTWTKLVYFVENQSGECGWGYTLAKYVNGKWYEIWDFEDITSVVRYWDDVKLPESICSY